MSCGQRQINRPDYAPKLYAGSSVNGGVERAQSGEKYSCTDPKFDNNVCLTYADLSCVYFSYVQNCKEFITATPTCPDVSSEKIKRFAKQRGML